VTESNSKVFLDSNIWIYHFAQDLLQKSSAIASEQVIKAIEIRGRYGFSYWDSLIVATALLSGCSILYSEDMQHDQVIESTLKIINPFI
jgi:predicted nucleic acid-binding protein